MIIILTLCDWWLFTLHEILIVGLIIDQPNRLFMNICVWSRWHGLLFLTGPEFSDCTCHWWIQLFKTKHNCWEPPHVSNMDEGRMFVLLHPHCTRKTFLVSKYMKFRNCVQQVFLQKKILNNPSVAAAPGAIRANRLAVLLRLCQQPSQRRFQFIYSLKMGSSVYW